MEGEDRLQPGKCKLISKCWKQWRWKESYSFILKSVQTIETMLIQRPLLFNFSYTWNYLFSLKEEKKCFKWRITVNIFFALSYSCLKGLWRVSSLYFNLSQSFFLIPLAVLKNNWSLTYWKANPRFLVTKFIQFRFWCKSDPNDCRNFVSYEALVRNTSCCQFMNAANQKKANLVTEDVSTLPIFSCVVLAYDIEELNTFLESAGRSVGG